MKLGVKIAAVTAAIVIIMGLLTIFVIYNLVGNTFEEQMKDKGISIARLASEEVAEAVLEKEWFKVQQGLEALKESDSAIVYAYISQLENGTVIHTFSKGFPANLLEVNRLKENERSKFQLLESGKGKVEDIAFRVLEGLPYELHLGLSQQPIETLLNKTTWSIAFLTFQGIIWGTLLAIILSHFITRPLQILTKYAIRIGQIDWTKPVPIQGKDEVGKLAKAFNYMTEKMQKYVDELQNSKIELEKRNRELALLNEISRDIGGLEKVQILLHRAIEEIIAVMGLDAACVLLLPDEGVDASEEDLQALADRSKLLCWGECGWQDSVKMRRCWLSMSDMWRQLRGGEPYTRLQEGMKDPYVCPKAGCESKYVFVVVPLMAHEKLLGLLSVRKMEDRPFEKSDINTLTTVGRQLGVAIENRRFWEELQEREHQKGLILTQVIKAQEEERKRIARELHDETSQSLAALSIGLKSASITSNSNPDQSAKLLENLKAQLGDIIKEIHKIVYDLRPSLLDDIGFIPAIRWFAVNRLQPLGIASDVFVKGAVTRLLPEMETAIFRILQEAITNAAKYSQAKNMTIEIIFSKDLLEVKVSDDGVGFDREKAFSGKKGLGLLGMRERASLLNGVLEINSRPGKGTSINLIVPFSQPGVS